MNGKKEKIAVLIPSMGSGGAEKVMSLLLQKLVKDYEVTLCLFFRNIHHSVPENVRVIVFSEQNLLSAKERMLQFPSFITKYLKILKEEKILLSLSFLTLPNFINGIVKKKLPDVKAVISERNYPSIEYRSSSFRFHLYKLLIPVLYKRADAVFSNSEHINADLRHNFGVKKKMSVIYNPIVLPETYHRSVSVHDGKEFRLIHVGRLIEVKNHKMILNAVENISVRVEVDFLGDGHLKDELEKLATRKNLGPQIHFRGNVKDVHSHLMQSQCFVFSSLSEGFPNALLEAMAAGLPVISANCKSGPLELLNDNEPVTIEHGSFVECRYGILVNVDDYEGMQKAIAFLYHNPDKLNYYCKKSRERAEHFSLDIVYEQVRSLLEEPA